MWCGLHRGNRWMRARCVVTWTKLSDDFGDQCAELSDHAFRTHVEGLLWAMRRESGGALTARDVRRFAESPAVTEAVAELIERGFWDECDDGYRVRHHMGEQIEPEVIAARRKADAVRQARKRRKLAGLVQREGSRRDSGRDTPAEDTRDPGLVGSGLNGKPKNGLDEKNREGTTVSVLPAFDTTDGAWASPPTRQHPAKRTDAS